MKEISGVRRRNLIEPELSYRIVGILFDVSNTLGPGYSEAYYQRAFAAALEENRIKFKREILLPVKFHDKFIGRQRCDFLIEGKILVEIKKGNVFFRHNIEQLFNYVRASGLRLGILVNIGPKGVMFKRIVNTDSYIRKDS